MAQIGQYKEQAEQDFVLPDEGYYVLKLVGEDDPKPSQFDKPKGSGNFPLRCNLKFEIVKNAIDGDDEFAGEEVGLFVGLDLEPWRDDSVYHVLVALEPGEEPDAGSDTRDYWGRQCVGEIKHVKKASSKEPGKTVTFANVVSVKPYKKKKAAAEPKPKPVVADDDPFDGEDEDAA